MSKWIEGTVVGQKHWTDRLCSLQVKADIGPFKAGQFAKLALAVDGDVVARPYSFVNPPRVQPCEFYYVVVPEGPLSPRLARLEERDAVFLAPNPAGFLVLAEVPDAATLWMIATGTGIGPFLSILRTDEPWRRFAHCVLVHAVRYAEELTYGETIAAISAAHGERFRTVRFVSRALHPGALQGRIPAAIEDGRLEHAAGLELSASTSQAMICGNPDAVADTTAMLKARGMKKNRRREPGHITVENYW